MSFTLGIPAAQNNPSNDQPLMQNNFTAINNWVIVDHVGFNNLPHSGRHLQVTFDSENLPPLAPTDPVSILYTGPGTASTNATLFYQNASSIYQALPIKAWAYADGTGAIIGSQSSNVTSITRTAVGRFSVVLSTNAVSSNQFAVHVSSYILNSGSGTQRGYNITGVGTFQLVFLKLDGSAFADPTNFSFEVLQI